MSQLGIKQKLFGLCALVVVVCLAIGTVSLLGLRRVSNSYERVAGQALPDLTLLNDMFLEYRSIRINLRTLGLADLPAKDANAYVESTKKAVAEFERLNKVYSQRSFQPGEKERYADVQASWVRFRAIGVRALGLHAEGTESAIRELHHIFLVDCPEAAADFSEKIEALKSFHKSFANRVVVMAREDAALSNWLMIGFSAVGLLITMIFGYFLSTQMSRSIEKVAHDLSTAADTITRSSENVGESTRTIAEASNEQAASVQQTAASLEEITSMIVRSNENAARAAEKADDSRERADRGRVAVEEMVTSMSEISRNNNAILAQMDENGREMSSLVSVIEDIAGKTKVINEIVFQTKLLSFNASVEAARAGEHGKGFAVVAAEIGNLASMSGKAAQEIGALLDSSTDRVRSVVESSNSKVSALVRDGAEKVTGGVRVAERCSETLSEILENVSRVSELSREISAAGAEQSSGVSEINRAVTRLDSVTQKNASAGAQTAEAATSLSAEATALRKSVLSLSEIVYGHKDAA